MNDFQNQLKNKMNGYVLSVYRITKYFPKEEVYGVISQFRRSSLSVILNYIEGYARRKPMVRLNFLEIAYGSFQESKYLLYFSKQENFIDQENYLKLIKIVEEIGAMLYTEISNLSNSFGSSD